jgi:hypothetical protein
VNAVDELHRGVLVSDRRAGSKQWSQRPIDDEPAILAEAARQRIALATMTEHRIAPAPSAAPVLPLGYGQVPEAAIRPGVHELAEAIRTTRAT